MTHFVAKRPPLGLGYHLRYSHFTVTEWRYGLGPEQPDSSWTVDLPTVVVQQTVFPFKKLQNYGVYQMMTGTGKVAKL